MSLRWRIPCNGREPSRPNRTDGARPAGARVLRRAVGVVLGCGLLAPAFAEPGATAPPPAAAKSPEAAAPAEQPTPPAPSQTLPEPAKDAPEQPSTDQLYEAGRALFDRYAPPEIKEQYDFPSKEQWDEFSQRLQGALDGDDLKELGRFLPEARTALTTLRTLPGYDAYADWLQERIDYLEAAGQATQSAPPTTAPSTPTAPAEPAEPKPSTIPAPVVAHVAVPYYELWLERIRARPTPDRADKLMPLLAAAFVAEGVPGELAWLAEAESTLNPAARSPAGAKGLFQLMPDTAKSLGLSTFMPDERTNVEKSARAAAKYLRQLHEKFGDWPLAFAAYNAGEGRVARLLKQKNGASFADIAGSLRAETRMYVPKVCATIAVRAGVPITALEPAAG